MSARGKNFVYYVYDLRTTMSEFVASFAVRSHADEYARRTFGEHAYVTGRRLHGDHVWDGRPRGEGCERAG